MLKEIDTSIPRPVRFITPPIVGPDKRTTTRKSRKDRDEGTGDKKNKSSRGSSRGFRVINGVIVQHESLLESRFCWTVQARTDVEYIFSQATTLHWRDDDEVVRKHVLDYVVKYRTGTLRGFILKMERKRAEMEDLIARLKAFGIAPLDDIKLVTETYATYERAENARWVLWGRENHDELDVEILLEIVKRMTGWFRFGDLLRGCNDVKARRVAIWRLIDLGVIFSPTGERITEVTWLRRATNFNN